MNFSLIVGSHRASSQSGKVAKYLNTKLQALGAKESKIFDLGENPLPLWDTSMWERDSELKQTWNQFSEGMKDSDGFIFLSPEYAGMASPALKNLFLYASSADFAHKPGLIITVSSGMGGSYPNAELRMSSYKNTRIVYIPDHVIVRHVESVLNGELPVGKEDEYIRERLDYSLSLLIEYSKALTSVRNSSAVNLKKFPFGL